MSQAPARRPREGRRALLSSVPLILVPVVGFLVAYAYVEPAPPRHLRIASGSPSGAYHRYALRYRESLAEHGIELQVEATRGSADNLTRIRGHEPEVDLAFVQGGVGTPAEDPQLRSAGTLYFEPLWIFLRAGETPQILPQLAGRRLAVGAEGSGTRAVALVLLRESGIHGAPTTLLPLEGEAGAAALRSGGIDALFLVGSPQTPLVQELLRDPSLSLMDMTRAEAYAQHHRYLSPVVLHRGVVDLAADVPARDVTLLAPVAELVVREGFHPALVDLLLPALQRVHGRGTIFSEPGTFPTTRFASFPLSSEAAHYYRSGPPFLNRFLPFWAANLADRLKILLLPLLTLLFPLFKLLPALYAWRMNSRVYRLYTELDAIEERSAAGKLSEADRAGLKHLHREARRVSLPASYVSQLYEFREHLESVSAELTAHEGPPAAADAEPEATDSGEPPPEQT